MTVGTGTKRTRESSDVTVHGQPSGKRLCRFSPEVQQAVYNDQVALLHIAVLVQPVWLVPLHHRSCLLPIIHQCMVILTTMWLCARVDSP